MDNEKNKKEDDIIKEKSDNKKNKKENIILYNIIDFCSIKRLNKYHTDAFRMIFGVNEMKSIKEWENELISKKLIDEKVLNK